MRRQLQAILASRSFVTATRAQRFLTYIVEQTLAGQNDSIKELVLASEVFDRPSDFDPKADPIVRVEAGRLRKRLDGYYSEEGAEAEVRINIPVGSYVPQFQCRTQVPTQTPAPHIPNTISRRRWLGVCILALLLMAASAWWAAGRFRGPEPATTPSIAVLPFLNLSPDPANVYFTDGMAEELTDALANAGGLRVAARTSAFVFKGKVADVREIGAKLHVRYVIEGSVRKQDAQLKVTAQLIRTDDGYHVWSDSFERKLSNGFAVQQEIAQSVVRVLKVKLTTAEDRRLKKTHTANQQAFDLYLQGRHALNSFTRDGLDRAERLFQQSISADPAYALAYVGLAETYRGIGHSGKMKGDEVFSRMSNAIQQALSLDDELPEAHALQGVVSVVHDYDWAAGERHLRYALKLNPSSAFAHQALAMEVLANQGRFQEARAESRYASELDPLSRGGPISEPYLSLLERRTDVAVEGFRALALVPASSNDVVLNYLAISLGQKGDYEGALTIAQRLATRNNLDSLAHLAVGYARLGNHAETRKILEQLLEASRQGRFVSPTSFAMIYRELGDLVRVFQYLEMAREQHDSAVVRVRVFFLWDPIRTDSRFLTLLHEIGLSDEQIPRNQ